MNLDLILADDLYYILALIWLCVMSFGLGLIIGLILW